MKKSNRYLKPFLYGIFVMFIVVSTITLVKLPGDGVSGALAIENPLQAAEILENEDVKIRSISHKLDLPQETECEIMEYPSHMWQRAWYKWDDGSCLGNGPHETKIKFDNDWGQGIIEYAQQDKIKLISSRTVYFEQGTYSFSINTDDGSRFYIDDELIMDNWLDQAYSVRRQNVTFPTSGQHKLRLEWYENKGEARLTFDYSKITEQCTSCLTTTPVSCSAMSYPSDRWQRSWFGLDGSCLGDGPDELNLRFDNNWDWGNLAYGQNEYVKFVSSRTVSFDAGTYNFTLGSDDGSRLYVDEQLVIDNWDVQPYTKMSAVRTFASAGTHRLRIEFYENEQVARLSFDYLKLAVNACSDGTSYGSCSIVKPKYCDNGNLIDRCNQCGCATGTTCRVDGSCGSTPTNITGVWEATGWGGGGNGQSIEVSTRNPNILWAGSDVGGPFKSTDYGNNWVFKTNGFDCEDVISFAIDPADDNKVYAMCQRGVYKTTNGGDYWNKITPDEFTFGLNTGTGAGWWWSRVIAINPNNNAEIYAGSAKSKRPSWEGGAYWKGGGLWKSTDEGRTWSHVNSLSSAGANDYDIANIVIDPTNPQVIYVAVMKGPMKITRNGGQSWQDTGLWDISSIVVYPANTNIVYAAKLNGEVYKSTNAGSSWTQKHISNSGYNLGGYKAAALAIDKTNSNNLYLGLHNYRTEARHGIYKTTNGGDSWSNINSRPIRNGNPYIVGIGGIQAVEMIATDPNDFNKVYLATFWGIIKSTDGGRNWMLSSDGLQISANNKIAFDPNDVNKVYLAGGDSVMMYSPDYGRTWRQIWNVFGQSKALAAAKTNSGTVLFFNNDDDGFNGGDPNKEYQSRVRRVTASEISASTDSTNFDRLWAVTTRGLPNINRTSGGAYPYNGGSVELIAHPTNANIVYSAVRGSGIYKTTNALASASEVTWQRIVSGDPNALAIAKSNPSIMYATGRNWAVKSTDGGSSWTSMNKAGFGLNGLTYAIAVDPTNPNVLFVATQVSLIKSTDGGQTWTTVYDSKDDESGEYYIRYPSDVEIDPGNTNRIFLAVDGYLPYQGKGVFVSENGGRNWRDISNGLSGRISLTTLQYDPAQDTLWVGSQNGVFKQKLSGQTQPSFNFSLSNGGSKTVIKGNPVTNTVTATIISGSAQSVSFSAGSLPAGTTASFSPASCTITCTSTMTLYTASSTPIGNHNIVINANAGGISKTTTFSLSVSQQQPQQSPYFGIPFAVPTIIQAEDFDNGGENISYHDVNSNNIGGQYRQTGVDIQATNEGGYNVGWVSAGEWLEYNVTVPYPSVYVLSARVAGMGGTFHVEFDGTDKTGAWELPNTGSWDNWQTISRNVGLTSGNHIMRVSIDSNTSSGGTENFNYFNISTFCTSQTYPINRWQRTWLKLEGSCIGNGADELSEKFDSNWGTGAIAYDFNDYVKLISSRTIYLEAGTYNFTLGSDDGSKLYVDEQLVVDNWVEQSFTRKSATKTFSSGGEHRFRIEFYENAGAARISFNYSKSGNNFCSDSTPFNTCSATKPKYCDGGVLVNKCSLCGCASDSICGANENCIQQKQQTPYYGTPFSIPGIIQAEDFDNGGIKIAYNDTDSWNDGGKYRNEGVDIATTWDAGSDYAVGWVRAREWLEYNITVPSTGTYVFSARTAGIGEGGRFHVEFNGIDKTGSWSFPNTGGWENWRTISRNVQLNAGNQLMRIFIESDSSAGGASNLNYFNISSVSKVCSPMSYPTNYWQRVWYNQNGTCAGNGANELSEKFDTNWGTGALAYGFNDYVKLVTSRTIYLDAASYTFTLGSDDGSKLYIDEQLVIDNWREQAYARKSAAKTFSSPGTHRIRIEYYENAGNARLSFDYLGNAVEDKTNYGMQIDVQTASKIPNNVQFSALNPAWVRFVYRPENPSPALPLTVKKLIVFNGESAGPAPIGSSDINQWKNYVDNIYVPEMEAMITSNPNIEAIEIWNEQDICPDITYCPGVPAQAYAYMLKKSAAAIKAKNPNIKVIIGGLASGLASYVTDVKNADSAALNQVDAVGLHPYGKSPDGWCANGCREGALPFGDLAFSIWEHGEAAGKPVWVTEIGYGVGYDNWQAEYLNRTFTVITKEKVPVLIWYGWIDSMTGGDGGNNWGLYTSSGSIKPSGTMFSTFTPSSAISMCSDGTIYEQCSSSKPKYCDNGNLLNKCSTCGCELNQVCLTDGTCQAQAQTPFHGTPFAIPTSIQAEDFDNGGEGVAYHDVDSTNNGGQYRTEGVDVGGTVDSSGYAVNFIRAGEWVEYSVNVPSAGNYVFSARVSGIGENGKFHVEFNGVDKTGSWTIPNTGGWDTWQTISRNVQLSSGLQIMRVVIESNSSIGGTGNFNYFTISEQPSFDYSISNGGSRTVTKGGSTTNAITSTLVSGMSQTVTYSIGSLPAGVTSSFSTASCTPTCTSTLTLTSSSSTPVGTSTITVNSNGGGTSKSTSFSLSVTDSTVQVPQYSVYTINMNSASSYSNPYTQVTVTATFNGPNGIQKTVKGFWDGGNSYKVRFTPTVQGTWSYTITSSPYDSGLAKTGQFTAIAPNNHGFIRRDSNYPQSFVYDDGTRYFMWGQTYYEIIRNAMTGNSWQTAVSNSKQKGMNKVRMLIMHWTDNHENPYPETSPFAGNHDTLNLPHWQKIDQIVEYMASQGVAAEIIPLPDSAGDATGTQVQDERYIKYVIARYGAYSNVIWALTNEWEYGGGSYANKNYWNSIGRIFEAEDPWRQEGNRIRALTIHPESRSEFRFFGETWPSYAVIQYKGYYFIRNSNGDWLQTITEYTNGDEWGNYGSIKNLGRGMPVSNDEYGYFSMNTVDRTKHRNVIWGITTGGGYGTAGDGRTVATNNIPIFSSEWWDATEYNDIKIMIDFWTKKGIEYWKMRSQNSRVSGTRVYALGSSNSEEMVVYAAAGGTISANLPTTATTYSVIRFNPRDGTQVQLSDSGNGWKQFTMPDSQDWVLWIKKK